LARTIDWRFLEAKFGAVYTDKPGQPPLPTRLMAGLSILKHTYTKSHLSEPLGPFAQSNGHDAPRLIAELVPFPPRMVDEIVVGFEDAVGEPVVAHELPDVLDRVELWALRRQQNDGDIGRHEEARGQVPAGLIDQEDGVGSGRDGCGDLGEVQVHRL